MDSCTSPNDALLLPEIAYSIVYQLIDDVAALRSMKACCKVWRVVLSDEGLWQELVKTRFGQEMKGQTRLPSNCPLGPWQAQYLYWAPLQNALSDKERSQVTWGDTPQYFGQVPSEGSISRTCMALRNVCWLHVASTFKGVTPGRYHVVWRLDVSHDIASCYGLVSLHMDSAVVSARDTRGRCRETQYPSAIKMDQASEGYSTMRVVLPKTRGGAAKIEVEPGQPGQNPVDVTAPGWNGVFFRNQLPKDRLAQLRTSQGRNKWMNVEAGVVEVPAGSIYDVQVRMFDITGNWKWGLTWDVVTLVPVGQSTKGSTRHVQEVGPSNAWDFVQGDGEQDEGAAGSAPAQLENLVQRMRSAVLHMFTNAAVAHHD